MEVKLWRMEVGNWNMAKEHGIPSFLDKIQLSVMNSRGNLFFRWWLVVTQLLRPFDGCWWIWILMDFGAAVEDFILAISRILALPETGAWRFANQVIHTFHAHECRLTLTCNWYLFKKFGSGYIWSCGQSLFCSWNLHVSVLWAMQKIYKIRSGLYFTSLSIQFQNLWNWKR